MNMTAKVTKSKNIISGKNAKIYPKCGSIGTSYDRVSADIKKIISTPARSHKKKMSLTEPCIPWGKVEELRATSLDTPKPTPKPATILYKKLPDDMILITGFENFLSIDDILDRYGREIATVYATFSYQMSGIQSAIFLSGLVGFGAIRTGQVYGNQDFSTIIAHVKKCGGLLHDIIRAVDGGEIKRIEI
jgi:hypothetical protein